MIIIIIMYLLILQKFQYISLAGIDCDIYSLK